MSSEMNVIPEGPGSVSPRMKHRWTRVRGRAGPSSTQWPGILRRPLDRGVGVRIAWPDVCDVQAEDIPIPFDRLSRIGNDDRNRVDAEDGHANRDGIGASCYELECLRTASVIAPPPRVRTSSRTTP